MPPLASHKRGFLTAVGDCRILYRHCLAPRAAHSDPGVEAAFLQLYRSWESFLEECTLSFLCGRLRVDGFTIPGHTVSSHEEFARKALYQDRPYVEWTDYDKVLIRWKAFFVTPNLLEVALRPGLVELGQMTTIRNAIAHSSPRSQRKFADLVQGQFGGRRVFKRPATFLAAPWPEDVTKTFFDRYADVLEVLATKVAG
jgi:hypothetical protein